MGNPKAFLTINRKEAGYRPVNDRIKDYGEVEQTLNPEDRRLQASRCMECGVPFCHWSCPLGNRQPEWQDRLYKTTSRVHTRCLMLPTTSPNLPDAYALRLARRLVCSTRNTSLSPYARTSAPSPSAPMRKALSSRASPRSAQASRWLS